MNYHVELKPTAIKDLKNIPNKEVLKIIAQLESLEDDMKGNVKRLTNFTPEHLCIPALLQLSLDLVGSLVTPHFTKHYIVWSLE